MGRVVRYTLMGCGALAILGMLLAGLILVVSIVGLGIVDEGASSQAPNEQDPDALRIQAAEVGESVNVGEVTWVVTDVRQETRLRSFGETKTGSFVVVDLIFKNNAEEPVTLDTGSLAILDEQGRTSKADPDTSFYVPPNLDIFLDQVNPGVTQRGRVIFSVAPDAAGLILRAGDTDPFSDENGYVNLDV